MPPPKKPKSGPTSMDQFLSHDELKKIDNGSIRDRTGSYSGESEISLGSPRQRLDSETGSLLGDIRSPGLKLLRELIKKKEDSEEQRVPGSYGDRTPESNSSGSPTNTVMSPDTDKKSDIDSKSPIEKVVVETIENADDRKTPKTFSPVTSPKSPGKMPPLTASHNNNGKLVHPIASNPILKKRSDDKLLNSIIASTLMTSMSPSVSSISNVPSYLSPYFYTHPMSFNSVFMDSEPRDLTQRKGHKLDHGISHKLENGLHESRFYDSASGLSDTNLHPLSMHLGVGQYSSNPTANEKEYLDSRKNLVGILTEPRFNRTPLGFSNPHHVDHKDGPFGTAFPFFMNGFDVHRETLDQPHKLSPKEEQTGSGMMSPGGYLSMSHLMPGAGQVASSTTSDLRDHGALLPLLDPSMTFANSRKYKPQLSTGNAANKLCQVCNDNASGFHYGVWSCEGCKAFFKRSIQGPVDYVCPATNTCTIDKHRRKSCQACRLRKCYEVGMNKGSQRKDRKGCIGMGKQTAKRSRADSTDNTVNSTSGGGSPNPAKNPRRSQTSQILEALSKADLSMVESFHNHSVPPTKVHLLTSLIKLAEKELVHLINWAKNVPGYTELTLSDQVHLIECCWMELLLLNCAFRSMEHAGKRLAFAADLLLDRPHWSTVGMLEIFEQVGAVSEQLVTHDLHKDELLLLQATVLVNAEVRRLASYGKIHEMRQCMLDALVDTAQKYHPDNLRHVPSILLLLSHIRQAADRAVAYFQKLKSDETVVFCDLLKEMLDAQDYMDKRCSDD